MNESLAANWPLILIGLLLVVAILYVMLRPRQRVQLTDSMPRRPHMAQGEGKGLVDEAAAATSDVAGHVLQTQVHAELPGASGPADDLLQLKGVGPKLATLLNERGITRFDQIAKLNDHQVEALDTSLGAFRGRFGRDRIVEQAHYLARGDTDGFESRFGKL